MVTNEELLNVVREQLEEVEALIDTCLDEEKDTFDGIEEKFRKGVVIQRSIIGVTRIIGAAAADAIEQPESAACATQMASLCTKLTALQILLVKEGKNREYGPN